MLCVKMDGLEPVAIITLQSHWSILLVYWYSEGAWIWGSHRPWFKSGFAMLKCAIFDKLLNFSESQFPYL